MSTSPAKLDASRRNAMKSTGPITTAGKDRASRNNLRHGLLSREVLLDGEDAHALAELRTGVHDALQPVGGVETFLVEKIVAEMWRGRRLLAVDCQAFTDEPSDDIEAMLRNA